MRLLNVEIQRREKGILPPGVNFPGLVVQEDPGDHCDRSEARQQGDRVAKEYHREPDEQCALGGVGNAEIK